MQKQIDKVECMHASYYENQHNDQDDMVLVKERVTYTDGSFEPRLRQVHNYEREFFLTHHAHRNHNEKKEWEQRSKLQRFTTTQRNLCRRIRQAMGQVYNPKVDRYPVVARNQYLYGCDTSTPTLIKNRYDTRLDKVGKIASPYKVFSLDLETDVVRGTNEIISGAIVSLEEVWCYYTEAYEKTGKLIDDLVSKIREKIDALLPEYIDIADIKFNVAKVPNPEDVTIALLEVAHREKPDLLAIWNMPFDIGHMRDSLLHAGLDPAHYFSDPSIPPAYKYFHFDEAKRTKVMASGKVMSKHAADLWHKVISPASFYFVDAMCFYKLARVAKGMESSYALDYILKRNGLGGKLDFDIGEMPALEWHKEMSTKHKAEYAVYNIYDCLSMLQLDAKTKDLSIVLGLLCGHSELGNFTSTPRRLSDDMEFMCRERGLVFGTTSDKMKTEFDDMVQQMSGWIITLPNHHMHRDTGYNIFGKGHEGIPSGIVTYGSDSDAKAAYPSTEIAMNISKETTAVEVCEIEGASAEEYRITSINLTNPRINAVEIVQNRFNAPGLLELGDRFQEAILLGEV